MQVRTLQSLALGAGMLAAACVSERRPDGGGAAATTATTCPDDVAYFQQSLWEPLMSAVCIQCHVAEGLAKGSGMVLEPGDSPDVVQKNFATVRAVAQQTVDGTSILVLKPTGAYPGGHTGGRLVEPGSPLEGALRTFAARARGDASACSSGSDGGAPSGVAVRILRRLTRFEYDNTVSDLFGVDSAWGKSLPPDDVVDAFDDNAGALSVGTLFADKAREAAEDIADAVLTDPQKLLGCTPAGKVATDPCVRGFVSAFGARALRHPLQADETERYVALYAGVAADEDTTAGVKAVVAAMLQSPYFLYRLELGSAPTNGLVTLTDYEIATELSYLLVGSLPDDALFAAAKAGALHDPDAIATQAARLLASPKSRRALDHFVAEWLDLDKLAQVPKDATLFPDFTPDIRTAMRAETTELFATTVSTGTLPDLFSAGYSFMSAPLATFYGLGAASGPPSPSGVPRYAAGPDRGGILTHGSILATQGKNDSSAPIQRGKLVRERLLCQKLPPPPAGLNIQLPPVDPKLSNRERFTAHDQNPACATCHRLMDPIGFGFEGFDAVGRHQTADHGKPVDTTGEVLESAHTGGKFDGVLQLEQMLGKSPDVEDCFALQWTRFAFGESGDGAEAAVHQRALAAFRLAGLRLDALILALTRDPRFTTRAADPSVSSAPSGDAGALPPRGPDASGPPIPSPDAGQSHSASPFRVDRNRNSDWSTGYCEQVTVTNTGTVAADWSIRLTVDGTLAQSWSCAMSPAGGGSYSVSGVDFNRHLEPGANAGFGFCASK